MTIGAIQIQALRIQVVGLVCQSATATSIVGPPIVAASGGLLQSPVPSHGFVIWAYTTTMSADMTPIEATAFLRVVLNIKN